MEFQVYGYSIAGMIKKINQDHYVYKVLCEDNRMVGMFAVADGVGGLECGEIASTRSIVQLNNWWRMLLRREKPDLKECLSGSLVAAYHACNKALLQYNEDNQIRSATTLTTLLLEGNHYYGVHIGDSRIYRIVADSQQLEQLTTDHSKMVAKEVDGKQVLTRGLTQGIGYKQTIHPEVICGRAFPGDIFLVCTDGVYKKNPPIVLESLTEMYYNSMEELTKAIATRAMEERETDNITVIALKIGNHS